LHGFANNNELQNKAICSKPNPNFLPLPLHITAH